METPNRTRHYHELDSIRGLAALSVVLSHYSNVFLVEQGPYVRVSHAISILRSTPLYAMMAGHEAVMFFFVLSGFVLSLQFFKGKPVAIGPFAIKRLFRIYVPYLAVLFAAVLSCRWFYTGPIPDLSAWFNEPWSSPITVRSLIDHMLFLGDFKADQYDPVLWSLVYELRISLVFPLLMLIVLKLDWRRDLALAIALSLGGIVATLEWKKITGFDNDTGYMRTIEYAGMFVLGSVLARNHVALINWYQARSRLLHYGMAVVGFVLYSYSHKLPGKLNMFIDLPIACGAALLVLTALGSAKTSSFLNWRPIRFIGRVSYSLYLIHAVVLLAFVHALYGRLPIPVVLGVSFGLTILLSYVSYEWIELPAMNAGRRLTERPRSTAVAVAGDLAQILNPAPAAVVAVEELNRKEGTEGLPASVPASCQTLRRY